MSADRILASDPVLSEEIRPLWSLLPADMQPTDRGTCAECGRDVVHSASIRQALPDAPLWCIWCALKDEPEELRKLNEAYDRLCPSTPHP